MKTLRLETVPRASETIRKVQWFLDNLEMQIEERRLREEGRETLVYFDTSSVRAALLGMDDFLTANRTFDVGSFYKKAALVHALASAGWFGAMHMLLPHQHEFRTQANLDFGTEFHSGDLRGLTRHFLYALKIKQEVLDSKRLRHLDQEATIKFVRENAGSAEKLFKVIQFIRGTWRTKLVDWLDTRQLVISDESLDLAEVMGGMTFQRLRKAFDHYRREKDVNNSVDALALAELARKLRRFNSEGQKFVPVIFSPEGFFEKVIAKCKLSSRFHYTIDERNRLSAIRGPDYFIFRAIFDPPEDLTKNADGEQIFRASRADLTELRDRVSLILKARSDLEGALDTTTGLGDKPLGKLIDEIRNLTFFEYVWLPFSPHDLEQAEQELQELAEGLRSETYRMAADEALIRAKQEIDKKTKTYEELTELWQRLVVSTRELQRRMKREQANKSNRGLKGELAVSQELDPFLHFGLLRFSLPRASHTFIRKTLAALVSGDITLQRDAQMKVINKYRRVRLEEARSDEILAELVGLFWCLDLNQELIIVLESSRPLPSFSLDLMLAAAYFRLNQKVGEGSLLLQDLRERYRDLSPGKMGQLMIGLAYLNFHLILCLDLSRDQTQEEVVAELYENAIDYAGKARELLQDPPSRIYALNCYLYYMVEYGDRKYLDCMQTAAEDLKKWMDKPGTWQYRFDDTLARFHYFLSKLSADKRARKLAMEQAFEFIERAWLFALGDQEVLRFRSHLVANWNKS